MMKYTKRKMGFAVDKVSEDSFYENLLLGLSKILERSPCISNVSLKRFCGARHIDIRTWEHNSGVTLPEDLRAFYSSTNGFSYTYDFCYDYNPPEDKGVLIRAGKIEINPLDGLVRTFGYETKNVAQIEHVGAKRRLSLSRDSKIYELVSVDEFAKVVLVYINSYSIPTIWLCSSPMAFNYLAEDFTTYFRMCLAHLGIPCWQYTVTKDGVPEWTREIFQMIAPGVLNEDRNLVEIPRYSLDDINKIDPNIFNTQVTTAGNDRVAPIQSTQQSKNKEKRPKMVTKRHVSGRRNK